MPAHTTLKVRHQGQGGLIEQSAIDFKSDLLDRELKSKSKNSELIGMKRTREEAGLMLMQDQDSVEELSEAVEIAES